MSEISRRRLLGTGLAAAGAATAATLLPPNLRRAVAQTPRPGALADIEHVVVLMMENRSFDHYFGTLAGVRGFDDPNAMKLPNGRSVFYQPDVNNPAGYLLPFHLDTKKTSAQAIPSTSHAFTVQHEAWNGGKMDNWLPAHRKADGDAKGPYTMGYYTRDDIPFQFALAESFTLCDAYHCSVMGPTWPNRLYLWSASIDPHGKNGGPITSNVVPSPYTWKTYPERLTEAGVSWHVYQEEDDYGCNPLELFKAFQDADPSSSLYQHGLTIGPADKFEEDARNDRLPTVSWIVPTAAQCEHPDYIPASGADFVARKLDAIAANPEVWNKTVFILNYDENDGLFDHVAPPTPPAGTKDEFIGQMPIGGGFRVPCIIVSPWTQGGMVATEPFDHTSVLRFLELVTGVREPNITEWRRKTFGDLTSALGIPNGKPFFPALPPTKPQLWQAEHEIATLPPARFPGAEQTPPHQESNRPSTTGVAPAALSAPLTLGGSRDLKASRVTETLTNHAADFPDGVAGTSFPGIPVAAATTTAPKAPAKHAYVAEITNDHIGVIDTSTYKLALSIPSETTPYGMAATPDGSKVLVTNSGYSDVSVLDPGTDKITAKITVGLYPHGIVVSPDGKYAYVANTGPDTGSSGSKTVSVVDIDGLKVDSEISVGLAPHSVALTPNGATLYASCFDGLSIVDTSTGRVRATLADQARSNGIAVSPDGRHAYIVNCWRNTVSVIDTASSKVISRIPVGKTPWNVAFRPDGAEAYVTNANDDTLSVIDTGKLAVTGRINVGRVPTGINATEDTIWVSTNVSSTVVAISVATQRIVGTVELGLSAQPAGIAVV
jgi:phospholipase C